MSYFQFKVAGISNYYDNLYSVQPNVYDKVELVWETDNAHDDFAVSIWFKKKILGYVPANQTDEVGLYESFYVRKLNRFEDEVRGLTIVGVNHV